LVQYNSLSAQGITNFSSLKLKVDDRSNVDIVRKQLENIGLSTEYVGDTVSEIARVFSLFRVILGAFGLIALIVAALGTFNTLTVSLLERTKEVGLLKALGMGRKNVYRLFISEALLIGTAGGILGLGLGGAIGQGVNYILHILAVRAQADSVSLFITPWAFSVVIAFFSLVIGFVTGWYPAHRAVKLNPLDALRYE
jgi:putative ABC transport system permease protein